MIFKWVYTEHFKKLVKRKNDKFKKQHGVIKKSLLKEFIESCANTYKVKYLLLCFLVSERQNITKYDLRLFVKLKLVCSGKYLIAVASRLNCVQKNNTFYIFSYKQNKNSDLWRKIHHISLSREKRKYILFMKTIHFSVKERIILSICICFWSQFVLKIIK